MYNGLVHAHSGWRWVVLILLIVATVQAYNNWKKGTALTADNKKLPTFAMISLHIQFLFGLILVIMNNNGKVNFSNMMADSVVRFFTLEHTLMMIIAIGLVTVGLKKAKAESSFKKVFIFYLIALLVILAAIPWPFRGLGGMWF